MFSRKSVGRNVCTLVKKLSLTDFKTFYQKFAIVECYKTAQAPRGCVPVYVGEEHKRYDVPVKYLSLPKFQEPMVQSEHGDLDFKIEGSIMLVCITKIFKQLLKLAKRH